MRVTGMCWSYKGQLRAAPPIKVMAGTDEATACLAPATLYKDNLATSHQLVASGFMLHAWVHYLSEI